MTNIKATPENEGTGITSSSGHVDVIDKDAKEAHQQEHKKLTGTRNQTSKCPETDKQICEEREAQALPEQKTSVPNDKRKKNYDDNEREDKNEDMIASPDELNKRKQKQEKGKSFENIEKIKKQVEKDSTNPDEVSEEEDKLVSTLAKLDLSQDNASQSLSESSLDSDGNTSGCESDLDSDGLPDNVEQEEFSVEYQSQGAKGPQRIKLRNNRQQPYSKSTPRSSQDSVVSGDSNSCISSEADQFLRDLVAGDSETSLGQPSPASSRDNSLGHPDVDDWLTPQHASEDTLHLSYEPCTSSYCDMSTSTIPSTENQQQFTNPSPIFMQCVPDSFGQDTNMINVLNMQPMKTDHQPDMSLVIGLPDQKSSHEILLSQNPPFDSFDSQSMTTTCSDSFGQGTSSTVSREGIIYNAAIPTVVNDKLNEKEPEKKPKQKRASRKNTLSKSTSSAKETVTAPTRTTGLVPTTPAVTHTADLQDGLRMTEALEYIGEKWKETTCGHHNNSLSSVNSTNYCSIQQIGSQGQQTVYENQASTDAACVSQPSYVATVQNCNNAFYTGVSQPQQNTMLTSMTQVQQPFVEPQYSPAGVTLVNPTQTRVLHSSPVPALQGIPLIQVPQASLSNQHPTNNPPASHYENRCGLRPFKLTVAGTTGAPSQQYYACYFQPMQSSQPFHPGHLQLQPLQPQNHQLVQPQTLQQQPFQLGQPRPLQPRPTQSLQPQTLKPESVFEPLQPQLQVNQPLHPQLQTIQPLQPQMQSNQPQPQPHLSGLQSHPQLHQAFQLQPRPCMQQPLQPNQLHQAFGPQFQPHCRPVLVTPQLQNSASRCPRLLPRPT